MRADSRGPHRLRPAATSSSRRGPIVPRLARLRAVLLLEVASLRAVWLSSARPSRFSSGRVELRVGAGGQKTSWGKKKRETWASSAGGVSGCSWESAGRALTEMGAGPGARRELSYSRVAPPGAHHEPPSCSPLQLQGTSATPVNPSSTVHHSPARFFAGPGRATARLGRPKITVSSGRRCPERLSMAQNGGVLGRPVQLVGCSLGLSETSRPRRLGPWCLGCPQGSRPPRSRPKLSFLAQGMEPCAKRCGRFGQFGI